MNSDKAYLLGLSIGGGIWGDESESFRIRLPFKQWGSYLDNPQRAGQISQDILRVVGPMFQTVYGINISYEATGSVWTILCEGDLSGLRTDLEQYHIPCEGETRKCMNLQFIVNDLVDDNLKRRFIAGLADTIGSTNPNHRRFTNDCMALSFEINGFRFDSVCTLCRLLHSIKCYPDQILWNHPNFHAGKDPYSKQWKKGFKLRVLSDQYEQFGAFAFTSKAKSSQENILAEAATQYAEPCELKPLQRSSPTCYHPEEHSVDLPEEIRHGHYLHNRHVCAVLGCEHAPYNRVKEMISDAPLLVNPFPIISKEKRDVIQRRILEKSLYANRVYTRQEYRISDILHWSESGIRFLYGEKDNNGYPMNIILEAVNFLVCASQGKLNGLRPRGSIKDNIPAFIKAFPDAKVVFSIPDLLTPIIVEMGDWAAMVGPVNPEVYKKLLSISPTNEYKLLMREITEDDLR